MTNNTVKLPSEGDILEHLKRVDGKIPDRARLFEMIARRGSGQQLNATGIATLVASAIEEYMQGIHPGLLNHLRVMAPSYIDVLAKDENVRTAAKKAFERISIHTNGF